MDDVDLLCGQPHVVDREAAHRLADRDDPPRAVRKPSFGVAPPARAERIGVVLRGDDGRASRERAVDIGVDEMCVHEVGS